MNKSNMFVPLLIFLVINFAGLGIGGLFTPSGVSSEWYEGLNKAPWTPPGWVFGAAWTLIMITFSIYLTYLWRMMPDRNLFIGLFIAAWVLNVAWNPVFFYFQQVIPGLIIISVLTLLIGFYLIKFWPVLKLLSLLLLPYLVWLLIATSLNAYILVKNPL